MNKIIIASNRLPFKIEKRNNKYEIVSSAGGLVSALNSLVENYKGIYKIVWAGCPDFGLEEWNATKDMFPGMGFEILPVFLHNDKLRRLYYNGFSNSTLWPMFHYFPSFAEFHEEQYAAYQKANKAFSDEICRIAVPDDVLWVHDYHLLLLPGYAKHAQPALQVGFFLHIPFPSFEIFRLLPESWGREMLKSLLQADSVGLQTRDYVNHFLATVSYMLGVEHQNNCINYDGHICKAGDYPISIDFNKFHQAWEQPAVKKGRKALRDRYRDMKLIFSVDRLDYTKGVLNRLQALDKLFEENPYYREKIAFILNVIPSRDAISKYSERKKMIEENISRINGKYGNVHWQPILYQYRHLSFSQLLSFYTSCHVALVTPLRDGMNLVAKEFVASRADKQGVLVLSEMAGAASELELSIMVNPTDIVKLKDSLIEALEMDADEQTNRISLMQRLIKENDINRWLEKFFYDLNDMEHVNKKMNANVISFEERSSIMERYRKAERRLIILDYDGTLTDFTAVPEQAEPSAQLMKIMKGISDARGNTTCIVSGRKAADLERWFSQLNITLVAEHGCLYRLPAADNWLQMANVDTSWKEPVKELLKKQIVLYPGTFYEEKIFSLAWHYRNAESQVDEKVLIELNKKLSAINSNNTFKVLPGNKVMEAKCVGINKGLAVQKILASGDFDFVMAIGDDRTDEDMFEALAGEAYVTIKVGSQKTKAKYNLLSIHSVLSFLDQMARLN